MVSCSTLVLLVDFNFASVGYYSVMFLQRHDVALKRKIRYHIVTVYSPRRGSKSIQILLIRLSKNCSGSSGFLFLF